MSGRVRYRLERLERREARRPPCPCQDPHGEAEFIVSPPRVIGRPYEEPPPAPPRVCDRCGRTIEGLVFVVKPPRTIGAGGLS